MNKDIRKNPKRHGCQKGERNCPKIPRPKQNLERVKTTKRKGAEEYELLTLINKILETQKGEMLRSILLLNIRKKVKCIETPLNMVQ